MMWLIVGIAYTTASAAVALFVAGQPLTRLWPNARPHRPKPAGVRQTLAGGASPVRPYRDRAVGGRAAIVRAALQQHRRARELRDGSDRRDGNREEIQQTVLKLIVTAQESMLAANGRGIISIRTCLSGTDAVLEVSDDGPGVALEAAGRIFEPFFTTRTIGEARASGSRRPSA